MLLYRDRSQGLDLSLEGRHGCVSVPGSPEATSDDDIDADLPATPTTPATVPVPRIRKVEFVQTPQKTIFRYPQPPAPDCEGAGKEAGEDTAEDDDEWWWYGWEESEEVQLPMEDPPSEPHPAEEITVDAEMVEERLGRPEIRSSADASRERLHMFRRVFKR